MKIRAAKNQKKNKSILIKTVAFVLCVALFASLVSCKRIEEYEAKAIISNLLDRAYYLNRIYYGEGLKYDPEREEIEGYCMASTEEPMRTREAIEKETDEVFSQKIATELKKLYFEGTNSYEVPLFARYIGTENGDVLVNINYEQAVPEVYRYDTSTIEITKNGRNQIKANVYTTDRTAKTEVIITYSDAGWRIDSPTY